jgi:hypothetical protein
LLPFGRKILGARQLAVQMTHTAAEMRPTLSAEHLKIIDDHRDYQCAHFLLSAGDRYCYVIYSKHKRKRLPFVYIHYLSNPELFEQTYHTIRSAVMSHARACFAVIDERLAGGRPEAAPQFLPALPDAQTVFVIQSEAGANRQSVFRAGAAQPAQPSAAQISAAQHSSQGLRICIIQLKC